MKKLSSFLFAFALAVIPAFPCTNFLAGKNATVDGSTLISYAADSYSLFGFLAFQPAADHKAGDMRPIYDWDTGKYLGEIPEVAHTYSVVGNMNEYQLTIGETTYGGRLELMDTTAIMDYGSLIYVTLQRARTAREAIQVMTDLVEQYGYCSEGESFSIGDPNEVWILEMIGKGPGRRGAVWVAQRIPDDCISGHANQARITTINFHDKKNCLYSKDVISFAREKGYFSGRDADFSFSDTYNPLEVSGAYVCEGRVWAIFRQVSDSMDQYLPYIQGRDLTHRMPLYIRPNRKLSVRDFQHFMRNQFEGTPFDITQGEAAGPWHSKLRYGSLMFESDSLKYWWPRPVATQQTGWSFVAQMRSYADPRVGGIFWFGVDDAASSLYIPMYCRITAVPWCFDGTNGSLTHYSESSAFWVFNRVANFAYSKYDQMMRDIHIEQQAWEEMFFRLVTDVDQAAAALPDSTARAYLTHFSCSQAESAVDAWRHLGERLLVKYLDGQEKNEKGKVTRPPYPESYRRSFAPHEIPDKY